MAGSGRSRSDFRLVAELAVGATITDAAQAADVSERTVYRRLQDAGFQARLGQARDHLVRQTVGMLVASSSKAVEVLRGVMDDDDATDPSRIRAATAILQLGSNLREHVELAERVARLEEGLGAPVRRVP